MASAPSALRISDREIVVSPYNNLGPQFREIVHKVVGKAVVIVDDENHEPAQVCCARTFLRSIGDHRQPRAPVSRHRQHHD